MGSDEWHPANETGDSKHQSSESRPAYDAVGHYSDAVDLKGRPADKSKTGTWKAAPFLHAINVADFQAVIGVVINLVTYLAGTMHQPISKAATITTNLLGTAYLLTVLGGALADCYLGAFYTLCVGGISVMAGLGLLVLSTALPELQPAACNPTAGSCRPAGARYMAPLYVAIYTIAFGTGLVKPTNASLGGNQFDDTSPKERKQGVNFFVWFYFFTNIGLLLAFTLGIYLQDEVSRSWGYGFSLMFYALCFLIFVSGVNRYRHDLPSGSFLTRMAQVIVASLRKRNTPVPTDPEELYNPINQFKVKLNHTSNLRFFDRAAVIVQEDKNDLVVGRPNPWRLCSVTQVEESKRLAQFVPVWITLAPVTLVFSQLSTFTVQQGQTFDRRLGPHFVVPSASLGMMMPVAALVSVPIYDRLIVPFARRYTRSPYGFSPLQRLGMSLGFAILTMVCAALVERKRLTYVREMHLQALPLGAYLLPMKFWYLLPQYFVSAQVEFFLYVASYQFFYHEAAQTTRSIGTSFTYSASALGYYFSTILVNVTNDVTRNDNGGSWLKGQLNNGGLEKFYWLLAVFIGVDLVLFMIAAHFYQYKHDWYDLGSSKPETGDDTSFPPIIQSK